MKTVLVLGIEGFTGRHFQKYIEAHQLRKRFSFVGVDRHCVRRIPIAYRDMDLLGSGAVEKLIADVRPAYICNFAGLLKSDDLVASLRVNAELSARICETLRTTRIPVKKVLLVGSSAEYGMPRSLPVNEHHPLDPQTPYGISKAVQSHYAAYFSHHCGIPVVVARTFNLSGPDVPEYLAYGSFRAQIEKARNGGVIPVGNLDTQRDYIDIKDAVDAYWRIALSGNAGEVYNVCSGIPRSMSDILAEMIAASGKKLRTRIDPRRKFAGDIPCIYGANRKLNALKKA